METTVECTWKGKIRERRRERESCEGNGVCVTVKSTAGTTSSPATSTRLLSPSQLLPSTLQSYPSSREEKTLDDREEEGCRPRDVDCLLQAAEAHPCRRRLRFPNPKAACKKIVSSGPWTSPGRRGWNHRNSRQMCNESVAQEKVPVHKPCLTSTYDHDYCVYCSPPWCVDNSNNWPSYAFLRDLARRWHCYNGKH